MKNKNTPTKRHEPTQNKNKGDKMQIALRAYRKEVYLPGTTAVITIEGVF